MGKWQQVRSANIGVTYTGGYCLGAVADAFGAPQLFGAAYDDWLSGVTSTGGTELGNHAGELPPDGVQVPIYLYLNKALDQNGEQQGDVAISLGDGRVAAAAQQGTHRGLYIYNSQQAYMNDYFRANGGGYYLGWSEGTENTRVVQYVADVTTHDTVQVDPIPFENQNQDDPLLEVGKTEITQAGVDGTHTVITRITYSDGVQTSSEVISDTSIPAVPQITNVGTAPVITPVDPPDTTVPPPVVAPDPSNTPWFDALIKAIIAIFNYIFKIK